MGDNQDNETSGVSIPDMQENNRNPDGTFIKGISGNPLGRPKGTTLKEYQAEKFRSMSDTEKEEYLKDVAKIERWKMSEGSPHQSTDVDIKGGLTISFAPEFKDAPDPTQ